MGYTQTVLADTPLAYWPMDDVAGTSMRDMSGYANHGTYAGSPTLRAAGPLTGTYGVAFNGTSQSASAPLDLSAKTTITFEIWFWWNAFANDDALLFEHTPNNNAVHAFKSDPNDSSGGSQMSVDISHDGGSNYNKRSMTRPSAQVWHQLVVGMDRTAVAANQMSLVLDGAPWTPFTQSLNYATSGNFLNSTLYLASRAGASLFANCRIAHVAVFNGMLSAARSLAHYNEMLRSGVVGGG